MKGICLLAEALKNCSDDQERLKMLDLSSDVQAFLEQHPFLRTLASQFCVERQIVAKALIAIGQGALLFLNEKKEVFGADSIRSFIEELLPVERFYRQIGGIVGYHSLLLRHLKEKKGSIDQAQYLRPEGIDLSSPTEDVKESVLAGIFSLPMIAEMYPVGGAADRLGLYDSSTNMPMPAALLSFCGKTLLEWLIHDLQAREYLYFKLVGKNITVPVAMMTSWEKDNHRQILSLCEEKGWFGRGADFFTFFCQIAVPTVNKEGDWYLQSPLKLLMKPGGHGVIWKLAKDQKVFEWFTSLRKKKILVRQINNPIAGCDYGLLAFAGIGCQKDHLFGFASCLRQVQAAEGINVLVKKETSDQLEYCLTNIEYCDFKHYGIEDVPVSSDSCYSLYPSNTNILFADIACMDRAVATCPFPGTIVNLKKMLIHDEEGKMKEEELVRLESTMQNIADVLVYPSSGSEEVAIRTFLTYNLRSKTISTVKKEFLGGREILETPEGCYWDFYRNAQDLLENYCEFDLPKLASLQEYLEKGPCFDFFYHPSLGPLYSIISQKLKKGKMVEGSRLHLEIAELHCENLHLEGSLRIYATDPMGHREEGKLKYSHLGGRCKLSNVSILNEDCQRKKAQAHWKREGNQNLGCEIILEGDSEFVASDLVLRGVFSIRVESGFRVTAVDEGGQIIFKKEKLETRWYWEYTADDQKEIRLNLSGSLFKKEA